MASSLPSRVSELNRFICSTRLSKKTAFRLSCRVFELNCSTCSMCCMKNSLSQAWVQPYGPGPCRIEPVGDCDSKGCEGVDFMKYYSVATLLDCQALCLADLDCIFIEYNPSDASTGKRMSCELWHTTPTAASGMDHLDAMCMQTSQALFATCDW